MIMLNTEGMHSSMPDAPASSFPALGQSHGRLLGDGRAMTDLAITRPADIPTRQYVLDIVVPVYNEERDLPGCVRRLHAFLAEQVPYAARITVADNASTDDTLAVARELADELTGVEVIHLDAKGRGGALRAAWTSST